MTNYGYYNNRKVPLDKPITEVKGNKQYKVYTINPYTGRINLIRFGDSKMQLKVHIPKRRKSYCTRSAGIKSSKPAKLSPNYWSRKKWKC